MESRVKELGLELIEKAALQKGDLLVLGLSTSEVLGHHIGQGSSLEVGRVIVQSLLGLLTPRGIYLAVQACEHLNRALLVERDYALVKNLEIVSVIPSLHAGGAGQVAAFELFQDPVEVEFVQAQAGLDIGDTAIGMHVKHVQVPIRLSSKEIGQAHVTALASRPKLIGGGRAQYPRDEIRKS